MDLGIALVSNSYLLEKIPGKGGWTYAKIPEIVKNKNEPFGWVIVKGYIDQYWIEKYNLMPMGNGILFLPIKSEIRKAIKKQAGDYVNITLYQDDKTIKLPDYIEASFLLEADILTTFLSYSFGQQKAFVNWICSAKTDHTRINRINKTMDAIRNKLRFEEK